MRLADVKRSQRHNGIDAYPSTPLSAHFKLLSLRYHWISKLLMREAFGRRSPYPEKRPVCPRHSRLVQQSDHVDLPFDPDWNGSAHLRGRCSTILGTRQTQRIALVGFSRKVSHGGGSGGFWCLLLKWRLSIPTKEMMNPKDGGIMPNYTLLIHWRDGSTRRHISFNCHPIWHKNMNGIIECSSQ